MINLTSAILVLHRIVPNETCCERTSNALLLAVVDQTGHYLGYQRTKQLSIRLLGTICRIPQSSPSKQEN